MAPSHDVHMYDKSMYVVYALGRVWKDCVSPLDDPIVDIRYPTHSYMHDKIAQRLFLVRVCNTRMSCAGFSLSKVGMDLVGNLARGGDSRIGVNR